MFELNKHDNQVSLKYPTGFWANELILEKSKSINTLGNLKVNHFEKNSSELIIHSNKDDLNATTTNLFSQLNNYPFYDSAIIETFTNAEAPLVSCILLLPFNDLFARNVLLPSIIKNSEGTPIEIIIVYNGLGIDLDKLKNFEVIESEFCCLSKDYNKGVKKATGKYIALFHDDCLLYDPRWIQKSVEAFKENVKVVASEMNQYGPFSFGKAVPLFLKKEDYLAVGGFDEFYFAGIEDIDLACSFLERGEKTAHVKMDYMHLRGMTSSMVVHENPRQLKLLFGYQVLPNSVISKVHGDCMKKMVSASFIKLLETQYYLYLFEKYTALFTRLGMNVEERISYFKVKRNAYIFSPEIVFVKQRDKLIEAYKGLMNLEEIAIPV